MPVVQGAVFFRFYLKVLPPVAFLDPADPAVAAAVDPVEDPAEDQGVDRPAEVGSDPYGLAVYRQAWK